jgi:transposase
MMPPAYVKPYVKRQKNDTTDAEAICEAVTRPNMRFVSTWRLFAARKPSTSRIAIASLESSAYEGPIGRLNDRPRQKAEAVIAFQPVRDMVSERVANASRDA